MPPLSGSAQRNSFTINRDFERLISKVGYVAPHARRWPYTVHILIGGSRGVKHTKGGFHSGHFVRKLPKKGRKCDGENELVSGDKFQRTVAQWGGGHASAPWILIFGNASTNRRSSIKNTGSMSTIPLPPPRWIVSTTELMGCSAWKPEIPEICLEAWSSRGSQQWAELSARVSY